MTPVAWARIALALGAIAVFAFGIQTGDERVRYVGIGLLVVALLLRFARPPR